MDPRHLLAAVAAAFSLAAHAEVTVKDAWIRGVVPGQRATGAFMQLTSPTDAALVAVATPAAKASEVHTMSLEKGVMRMRPLSSLPLPAGKTVELTPGGNHLMLLDLTGPLPEGTQVPLTLTFTDAAGKRSTQTVNATVRALTGVHPMKH